MVSDHTNVFTNSSACAFLGNLLLHCYPHILRKFCIDDIHSHNGDYRKLVNNHIFPKHVAIQDVQFLHRCRTKARFLKLVPFVVEARNRAERE